MCNTRQFGSCRANNPSCPDPPPDMPATGVAERSRFFKPGYRGLGEPHMLPDKEMQPYGGYVDIQKTAASGQEAFKPVFLSSVLCYIIYMIDKMVIMV